MMPGARDLTIAILWQGVYPWDVRIEKFIRALSAYKVLIICRARRGMSRHEVDGNVEIFRIGTLPFPFNPWWLMRCLHILNKNNVSLIIFRDLPVAWLGITAGILRGVPTIFDMAENYPAALVAYNRKRYKLIVSGNALLPRLYEKWAVNMSSRVIVVADEQKERLVKAGAPTEKIAAVLNTPCAEQTASCGASSARNNEKRFLYTGKIDAHRGVDVAVRAFAAIAEKYPFASLVIAGSGRDAEKLKVLSRQLGIKDRVHFSGWVSHDEVYRHIAASYACLIPHIVSEHTQTTLPNKLFDYMAMSKPIISSDMSPVKNIIFRYRCGLVFKSGDTAGLASQMAALLDNPRAAELGRNGYHAVQSRFNWPRDSATLLNIISSFSPPGRRPI